jgi:chromosome segregation ATPase
MKAEEHPLSPEKILLERHGFHKAMMNQPSDLMWYAVYQAMEAYAKESLLKAEQERDDYRKKAATLGVQLDNMEAREESKDAKISELEETIHQQKNRIAELEHQINNLINPF